MNSRTATLLAVASVLGTVGIIAAYTGTGTSQDATAAALHTEPVVDESTPATLAQVTLTTAAPAPTDAGAADTTLAPETLDTLGTATLPAPVTTPDTLPSVTEAPTTTVDPYAGFTRVPAPAAPIPAVGTADGADTSIVQQRLLDLGFWLGATDGTFGTTTKQAVMAFQKYNLLPITGEVDQPTADLLTSQPIRAVASAREGSMVEINKSTQLLYIVRAGVTMWVLNASTGNGLPFEEEDQNTPGKIVRDVALTPDGNFKVNREKPEGWWEGDLGRIYRPKYFHNGIAVHGSGNVPNYPASHGCVRISTQAMDFIWAQDLMPMKSKVWVHA